MFFPMNSKLIGTVSLYFEATTVILTLVLLGQLLEARAHSQTSGAIKIVEISTRSHFGHRRS
jgi:Cu2+-exporting ATPase